VEAAAKCLEIAIKHGADTETPTTELERILGELVAGLKSLTAAADTVELIPPNGETPDLLPALDRLQTLLEDYDGEASDLISEIESQGANTAFARSIREIGERIDEFEFDEALELVNALRRAISTSMTDSANRT
jgi:hypothetical protein